MAEQADASDEARVVRLTIPAKAEYIALSRLALAGLARLRELPDGLLADLKLAITEATSNSVRHAYAGGDGEVEIVYELRADALTIQVTDEGTGFEPHGPDGDEPDELSEGGLGIAIIRAIADELEIEGREGGGSRLRFVKRLSA